MADILKTRAAARGVLEQYELCDSCLGRMFSKGLGLRSNRRLGARLRDAPAARCYVCRGLMDSMNPLVDSMLARSERYEFDTFAVGAQVRPSVLDRDDFVRSRFRLAGTDGIKTEVTRELAKRFSRRTKRRLDNLAPDLTITVCTRDGSCAARAKPVLLYGSYVKNRRGFPQKQAPCASCSGAGCTACRGHGIDSFESVEGRISKELFARFGCTTVRFTWIGGEDRSSLVLNGGRPFFAKIHDPSCRRPRLSRRKKLDFVELSGCRIIERLPRMPIRFHSTIRIRIAADRPIAAEPLKSLRRALRSPVAVYDDSGRRSEKSVSRVRYRRTSENSLVLVIDADGGLPVKRFVRGDNVSPGISQVLKADCTCAGFDFVRICPQWRDGNN